MPDKIKFDKEELEKINEFRQQYLDTQMGFGQVEITRTRLEKQFDNLEKFTDDLRKQFDTIQNDEQKFIAEINKKYGDGVLDPDTGVFTPNSSTKSKE
tara:strand:+ start:277 stop:570 length:294 start_codon:yes stop_codon:yes gene_type:complete